MRRGEVRANLHANAKRITRVRQKNAPLSRTDSCNSTRVSPFLKFLQIEGETCSPNSVATDAASCGCAFPEKIWILRRTLDERR